MTCFITVLYVYCVSSIISLKQNIIWSTSLSDLRGGDLGAGGVHDEEEPVHCDQHDREGGEEDAAGLGGADQLAEVLHVLAQGPVLGEEVHQGEGHGEGAEEDVGDGEVGDEDVPGGEHDLVGEEGEQDREVADHAEDDDERVEHDQAVVNTGLQSSGKSKVQTVVNWLKWVDCTLANEILNDE